MMLYNELVDKLGECRSANTGLAQESGNQPSIATKPLPSPTLQQVTAIQTPAPQTVRKSPFDECNSAIDLTESWRLDDSGSRIKPIAGDFNCDTHDMEQDRPWFRFTGDAGDMMQDKCVPEFSCGGAVALWTDATIPRRLGVATNVTAYGSWYTRSCRQYSVQISVMRCSYHSHDLIYRYLSRSAGCPFSFCGKKLHH